MSSFFLLCSDNNGGVEVHIEDYCDVLPALMTGLNDHWFNFSGNGYVCQQETLPSFCPVGWTYYKDLGYEGHDSCLKVAATTTTFWPSGELACAPGSHSLTIASFNTSYGLWPFALALLKPSAYMFLGCNQSATAATPGSGWAWIDGTPAGNLNCGGGGTGCGLWRAGEPK